LRCYAPVAQLTPRERPLPSLPRHDLIDPRSARPDYAPLAIPHRTSSRTLAGPTTLGLLGRLGVTAVVVALLVSGWVGPLGFAYAIGYVPIAVVVLRATWAPTWIDEGRTFVLPPSKEGSLLRWGIGVLGLGMTVVAMASGGSPLAVAPGLALLAAAVVPPAWHAVELGIADALERPVVLAAALNVLNVVDVIASDAAIRAGQANELNPLIGRAGTGAKVVLVLACSLLLLRIRPRALLWPVAVFAILTAYHLTGWLLMA
jgi:hypothetical protein